MGGWQATLGNVHGGVTVNLAQNLRSAAAQQQKLAAQQAQQTFNDELEIRKAGGVPYEPLKAEPNPDPKSLTRRSPNAAQQDIDPGRIITMPDGRRWLMPDKSVLTPEQQATQTREGTGQLLGALEKGAQPVTPSSSDPQGNVQRMGDVPRFLETADPNDPNAQSQLVPEARSGVNVPVSDQPGTVVESGGKKIYVPTQAEKSGQEIREKTSQASAMQDADGWTLPEALARAAAKHAGLPENALIGVKLPHETVADAFKASLAGAPKENNESPIPGYQGPKGGPLVRDTKSGKVTELELPAGSKPALTEEQKTRKAEVDEAAKARQDRRDQAEDDRQQKVIESLTARRDKLSGESDNYRQLAEAYNGAIGLDNGQPWIDPMDKGRVPRQMNQARRSAAAEAYKRYKAKAAAIDEQVADLGTQIDGRKAKRTPKPEAPPAPAASQLPTSVSAKPIDINRKMPPAKRDKQMHQGRMYTFDGSKWVGQ